MAGTSAIANVERETVYLNLASDQIDAAGWRAATARVR